MKYKLIIFDFDGTIASSLPTYLEIYNSMAKEMNLKQISDKEIPKYKDLTPKQILTELNIPFYRIPLLLLEGRKKLKEISQEIQSVPGMAKVLNMINEKVTLIMLTSNTKNNVTDFLDRNKINYFVEIWNELNIFKKENALKKIINKYGIDKSSVLYVGDEVRDIESCKKAGVDIAAVTWGFNSMKILKKYKPNYLFENPSDLITLV